MIQLNTISRLVQIPSISDAVEQVVQDTETAIIADITLDWGALPKRVYFMHDTPKKVAQTLQEYTNSPDYKNKKYPLVILFEDIRQTFRQGLNGITTSFKARMAICTLTDPSYRAPKRDAENFNPILTPIAEELIRQFSKSKSFGSPTVDAMELIYWKRYSWGAVEVDKNILNDYIDAIELESITLNLKNIC